INELILSCLSENERYIVQHLLNNIELFHRQEKSASLYPVTEIQVMEYCKVISQEINDFLDGQDLFVNATVYDINRFTPLMMIKLSFDKKLREVATSEELIDKKLKNL